MSIGDGIAICGVWCAASAVVITKSVVGDDLLWLYFLVGSATAAIVSHT